MESRKYKYRVYGEAIGRSGNTYGCFLPDQYNDAKALYDHLVAKGHEAIHLQELSLEHGWVTKTLEKHVTEAFKARKEAYWRRLEEKEERNGWRPGDAPWKAPGMSVRDFF